MTERSHSSRNFSYIPPYQIDGKIATASGTHTRTKYESLHIFVIFLGGGSGVPFVLWAFAGFLNWGKCLTTICNNSSRVLHQHR